MRVSPNPIGLVSLEGQFVRTDRGTLGERHANMKAESKDMCLQAKQYQRLPANHQKLGERQNRFSFIASKAINI